MIAGRTPQLRQGADNLQPPAVAGEELTDAATHEMDRREYLIQMRRLSCPGCGDDGGALSHLRNSNELIRRFGSTEKCPPRDILDEMQFNLRYFFLLMLYVACFAATYHTKWSPDDFGAWVAGAVLGVATFVIVYQSTRSK